MAIEVYTETICGLCGEKNRREGAEGFCPPIGWAIVDLTYRFDGSGWTNSKRFTKILCPNCADKIKILIEKGG